ncbi:hypothetical protein AMATHDRAFT_63202 [Amanita thiersii Skay4041]|uniref:Uncharacterized protein n=1 Tax=Amanita thiersii Skay4041 TaxID=703135 RepID=A0A2A9NJE5_9AGAR|nr:hypothetical protein AMATHDRAFT_63202 [Amanita thiersii Skay4041]
MVAHNPLFHGRWTWKRFQATVVNDIWPEVLFFTLISIMVTVVSEKTPHKLIISNQLLTVLGTVLGLVISFRTSSAYERYQDGRKMWVNISVASRSLAQLIWLHAPFEREAKDGKTITVLEATIEKKSMVNLIQAFSVAVKHFLRGEEGIYYDDLYPIVSFLPKYASTSFENDRDLNMLPLWSSSEAVPPPKIPGTSSFQIKSRTGTSTFTPPVTHSRATSLPLNDDALSEASGTRSPFTRSLRTKNGNFDPEQALPFVESDRPLRPARNPPKNSILDYFPFLRIFKFMARKLKKKSPEAVSVRKTKRHIITDVVESNVPMEIYLYLSNYSGYLMRNGWLQPAIATAVTNNLSSLHDTTAQLERIRNTPLPFAYQAHLRMSLWLYLLFLPFQIYSAFRWFTIPGTAFTSFLLLGFLEIGQEIENPFGYDLNDLDIDGFCLGLQRELQEITTHAVLKPSDFLFTPMNQPFAPADRRSASDLVKDGGAKYRAPDEHVATEGYDSIRRTLVKNWRVVEETTREFKQ